MIRLVKSWINYWGIVLLASLSWHCHSPNPASSTTNQSLQEGNRIIDSNPSPPKAQPATLKQLSSTFPYELSHPSQLIELPKKLKEISGLSYYEPKQCLVAVQDEKGILYTIDVASNHIEQHTFSADGDYEGLACKQDLVYALRADGVLFKISGLAQTNQDSLYTKVVDTNLGEINETEGLAYDQQQDRLLIACKQSALIGKKEHSQRGIYEYRFVDDSFNVDPVVLLDRKDFKASVKDLLKQSPNYKHYRKIIRKAKKEHPLRPTGIAIHPQTGYWYLLSTAGHSLIVTNPSGKIQSIQRLPSTLFEQPEGICFDPAGNLFIATEGVNKRAKIYCFELQQ